MDIVSKTRFFIEKIMDNSFDHGLPHVYRVLDHAYDIVEHEGLEIDRELLETAILLHDTGRLLGEPHAYYSALIARSFLLENNISSEFIEKVVNAILYHSYSYARKHNIKPLSEEAKILSDADKLDALGIVGFLRVFLYDKNRSLEDIINHFYEKILKLPDLMHYRYSRNKAEFLRNRIIKLLEWFNEEPGR